MPRSNAGSVSAAKARRSAGAGRENVRIEFFIDKVSRDVTLSLRQRVKIAVGFLVNQTRKNISVPVKKENSSVTGRVIVTERSKEGEFPRADTTQLLKTIFGDTKISGKVVEGFVGTPLDYGVILETSKRLDRSFLVRTLREERSRITRILSGPITGI